MLLDYAWPLFFWPIDRHQTKSARVCGPNAYCVGGVEQFPHHVRIGPDKSLAFLFNSPKDQRATCVESRVVILQYRDFLIVLVFSTCASCAQCAVSRYQRRPMIDTEPCLLIILLRSLNRNEEKRDAQNFYPNSRRHMPELVVSSDSGIESRFMAAAKVVQVD